MKKLIWMFVAVAAISFASCGGNKTTEAPADAVVIEEVIEEAPVEVNDSIEVVEEEVAE